MPADFEKVPFEQYLYVDNLFQGYLHTQQEELLLQMAQVLYGSDSVKPSKAHLVGVFYWMAVCVSDISQGFTDINNTPHTRRVKTVFLAMRHAIDNMEARQRCMDMMLELFRQFMSVLILEQTKLQEHCIYLDPRISFQEIDRYFLSGCACAYFQIAVDTYTDLQYMKKNGLTNSLLIVSNKFIQFLKRIRKILNCSWKY